jgi:formate--tetrahydrofolate ligase
MATDLEIAQEARARPIQEVAEAAGVPGDCVEPYGRYKAKVSLEVLERLGSAALGRLIVVTSITPTPFGEGKTVTSIGLAQGLARLGKKVFLTLRQPSMGPVFGIKGGAAGGGFSQVLPMEELNLHFTGDNHAVAAAHNLLAAMVDASIFHRNPLKIDPLTVSWRRVMDINDRSLREVIIGLGGRLNGHPRASGFDITAASEVMAILALADGLADLRRRLGRIVVGYNYQGRFVNAEELKAAGAMCVLLKEALKPNLVQTIEGQPCLIHTGPFGNVAHGNSSVVADRIGLKLADYVVTESGFAADCGFEKFADIKCRQSGLRPSCAVINCTVRALKMHGGKAQVVVGKPLPAELLEKDCAALERGLPNLAHCIGIVRRFGLPMVVSINRFETDHAEEVALLREKAQELGAHRVAESFAWARGGRGAEELAQAVVECCEEPSNLTLLYPDKLPIHEKIDLLARHIYNAEKAELAPLVERQIRLFEDQGWSNLPINMAKTSLSISHNPHWKNLPSAYVFPVSDIRPSIGAGFLYPLASDMMTMPGLPSRPAAVDIDIDASGKTVGLF